MNRKQIESWLLLEGWSPNREDDGYYWGAIKESTRVYWESDSGYCCEHGIGIGDKYPWQMCSWADVPLQVMRKLYNHISEN